MGPIWIRITRLAMLAMMPLVGLTTCSSPTFCNRGQVAFFLPTPDDSLAFDAFLCIEGGDGGGPSFDMTAEGGEGGPFEVAFFDPSRPGESVPSLVATTLSSEHCEEGIRVEVYRNDTSSVSSSGFVRIRLSMSEPEVCTIDLMNVEDSR